MGENSGLASEVLALSIQAANLALSSRNDLQVDRKPDGSLVTNGDKCVEEWLLPKLVALTPGCGFWGEEGSRSEPTDEGFWLLDPIDGTTNYAYGQPLWGVTAGYMHGGRLQIGTIVMPELGLELLTERGKGVLLNGKHLDNIPPGEIATYEPVGHGSIKHIGKYSDIGKGRHLGAFVAEGLFVATQQLRAMTTNHIKLYDASAGILAVRELGGIVCHTDGSEFDESKWTDDARMNPLFLGPINSNFPFDRA